MLQHVSLPHSFCAQIISIVWIYHILFIHSSDDEHLGYFHLLAIVSRAAMNICAHVLGSYVV